ncbi:hypothetical protein BDY24DRAFT_437566 [Mrakia frigida]|uniref:uncharacterized protein n=1 Tax=Mrakia frigida TaxID=29902 RepID=UPI003FCBFDA0
MSIPIPSPPDSPTSSSASVKYGALPRLSHPFPTTPSTSDSALPSFFSSVAPPDTAPHTPVHFDEESSVEDAVVMTGKSVWLSTSETSSSKRSLSATPKGHPLSSWPGKASEPTGLGLSGLGVSLAGLLKLKSGNSEERRSGRSSSPLPGSHTHRAHKATLLSSVLSRRARPFFLVLLAFIGGLIYLLTALRPSSRSTISLSELRRLHRAQAPSFPLSTSVKNKGRWVWGEGQEAAALIDFLSSEGTHALPPLSESGVLDPALVLDFNPHSSAGAEALTEMVENVWNERVVVLLGKGHGDPVTRKLRSSIEDLWVVPSPVFIEVTQRHDADHLIPILKRLFNFKSEDDLPILLIGGAKAGHLDLRDLLDDTARTRITTQIQIAGGSFVDEALRKKSGRKH